MMLSNFYRQLSSSFRKTALPLVAVSSLLFTSQAYSQACPDWGCAEHPAKETMQEMYIAYYGRPADPAGLTYWADRLEWDESLENILSAFGDSQEYLNNYGQLSNAELVNGLFQQMFNRDADPEGLEFYTARLDNGEASLASIAKQIADGALNSDATTLENKVKTAFQYTNSLPQPCGFTGCDYDWPTAKIFLESVDDDTSFETLTIWSTQARVLALGDNYVCDNCIWSDDSQGFSYQGISFPAEGTPGSALDFLKTISISKTQSIPSDCVEIAIVYPSIVINNSDGTTKEYRADGASSCHDTFISQADYDLLGALLNDYATHDIELLKEDQEPEYSIAVDTHFGSPTQWFEYQNAENEAGINTYEPSLWVYKRREGRTCVHTGLPPEESKQSLLNANIEVGHTTCGLINGPSYSPAVCDYDIGEFVAHQIGQSRLSYAEELGYQSLYSLQLNPFTMNYSLHECED